MSCHETRFTLRNSIITFGYCEKIVKFFKYTICFVEILPINFINLHFIFSTPHIIGILDTDIFTFRNTNAIRLGSCSYRCSRPGRRRSLSSLTSVFIEVTSAIA